MGKKRKKKLTQLYKTPDRWLPNDTTRPQTFTDKSKKADREAARGRTYKEDD